MRRNDLKIHLSLVVLRMAPVAQPGLTIWTIGAGLVEDNPQLGLLYNKPEVAGPNPARGSIIRAYFLRKIDLDYNSR